MPEEVRAAKRINSEGERIIEKAQEEAERIVARAQEQAAFLIEERGLTQAAEDESRRIIGEPRRTPTRSGAAPTSTRRSVLIGLEGDVVRTLQSIKKGIAAARRAPGRPCASARTTRRRRRRRGASKADEATGAVPSASPVLTRAAAPAIRSPSRVAGLLAEPPGATRTYPVAGVTIDLGDDLAPRRPDRGHVRLPRTNRGLLVTARLTTAWRRACSRCLRDIEFPLDPRHRRGGAAVHRHRRPASRSTRPPSPTSLRLTDHHELELEPMVREAIQLAEPIAPALPRGLPGPLSRPAAELAAAPHDHPEEDIDPRLEALAGLPWSTPDDGARPTKLARRPTTCSSRSRTRPAGQTPRHQCARPPEHRHPERSHAHHGSPQATRLARPAGRATVAPRAQRCRASRSVRTATSPSRPHHVCPNCGYYNGRLAIELKKTADEHRTS